MKFLIVNLYDPPLLDHLYRCEPGLADRPYREQLLEHTTNGLYFTADFYSSNLVRLGHEADDVIANSEPLQRRWATEHGLALEADAAPSASAIYRARVLDVLRSLKPLLPRSPRVRQLARSLAQRLAPPPPEPSDWLDKVLIHQVASARPDVVLNIGMPFTNAATLAALKPYTRLLVGQYGWPLQPGQDYSSYDLVLSSLPHFVQASRRQGLASELLRLGFEPRILARLNRHREEIPVLFIGNLSPEHGFRVELLEYLSRRLPITVCGYVDGVNLCDGGVEQRILGVTWGIETYQMLHDSQVVLNVHADFAGPFANNLRLYEVTGVGSLLVTDSKVNLRQLFDPGREVVAYRDAQECAELVEYYLDHDGERAAIAECGQQRTLREHTYQQRMQELLDILHRYL